MAGIRLVVKVGLKAGLYWGLSPPRDGGLRVNLLGLTKGPPLDMLDKSLKSEWEITGTNMHVSNYHSGIAKFTWGGHRCGEGGLATTVRGGQGHEGALLLDHRHILGLHLGRVAGQEISCQSFQVEVERVQVSEVLQGGELLVVGRRVELGKGGARVLHGVVLTTWTAR